MKRYDVRYWILPKPGAYDIEAEPHLDPESSAHVEVEASTPHTAAYRALVADRRDGRPVPLKLQRGEVLYLKLEEVASA